MNRNNQIGFHLCWHVGHDATSQIAPELFSLLGAIDATGALTAAAKEHELSYRHAWGLVRRWETFFGQSLVNFERGRGASLTPLGKRLLWAQQWVSARLGPELDSLASDVNAKIREAMGLSEVPNLRIFGSHGFAVELLQQLLDKTLTLSLDLQFRGGVGGLKGLKSSRCDMAGIHLPEGPRGAKVAARYLSYLDARSHMLIRVVRRQQGLMMAPHNAKLIRGLSDLKKKAVSFINRQAGSGTRLLFDALLAEAGIAGNQIEGYTHEEFTHMAVAAMVRSGAADVGFGIEAAARKLSLQFVPLASELYLFAVKRETLNTVAAERLLDALRSDEFRQQAAAIPGYSAQRAGDVLRIQDIFSVPEQRNSA